MQTLLLNLQYICKCLSFFGFPCCRHGWEYIKCAAESLDPLKCNADSIYGAVTVLMQANRSFFDRINPGRGEEVYSCINSKSTILNTYLRVWDF